MFLFELEWDPEEVYHNVNSTTIHCKQSSFQSDFTITGVYDNKSLVCESFLIRLELQYREFIMKGVCANVVEPR